MGKASFIAIVDAGGRIQLENAFPPPLARWRKMGDYAKPFALSCLPLIEHAPVCPHDSECFIAPAVFRTHPMTYSLPHPAMIVS
jgi:hypothetical protein